MTVTPSVLYPPPLRGSKLSLPEQHYMLSIQNLHPLYLVDTTDGDESAVPPPAGQDVPSGRNNLNVEITYLKISADANTFTLNGVQGGPFMLMAQYDVIKIKSNAIYWWPIG